LQRSTPLLKIEEAYRRHLLLRFSIKPKVADAVEENQLSSQTIAVKYPPQRLAYWNNARPKLPVWMPLTPQVALAYSTLAFSAEDDGSSPMAILTSATFSTPFAGAIIFDVYENQDARLVSLQIPEKVIRSFPRSGLPVPRACVRLQTSSRDRPAFGTILKSNRPESHLRMWSNSYPKLPSARYSSS